MTLNELFTSYNQVFPVTFQSNDNEIYSNLNRAKSASNNWKTGQHSSDINYRHWKTKVFSNSDSWINPFGKPDGVKNQTEEEKIEWMQYMKNAYIRNGIPEEMTKILIAQDAHETGWGTSLNIGDFNYGNIINTGWKGRSKSGNDTDEEGNRIVQKWRCYDSIDEYVLDKTEMLQRKWKVLRNDNINEFLDKIQQGTDDDYAQSKTYKQDVKNTYDSVNKRWNKLS